MISDIQKILMDIERIEVLNNDYVTGFHGYCGFSVDRVTEGIFETRLDIRPEHRQQDGFVHALVFKFTT